MKKKIVDGLREDGDDPRTIRSRPDIESIYCHTRQPFDPPWPAGCRPASQDADSEIRMDDGALHDDFSEQNRSWDDSGTIISET